MDREKTGAASSKFPFERSPQTLSVCQLGQSKTDPGSGIIASSEDSQGLVFNLLPGLFFCYVGVPSYVKRSEITQGCRQHHNSASAQISKVIKN